MSGTAPISKDSNEVFRRFDIALLLKRTTRPNRSKDDPEKGGCGKPNETRKNTYDEALDVNRKKNDLGLKGRHKSKKRRENL